VAFDLGEFHRINRTRIIGEWVRRLHTIPSGIAETPRLQGDFMVISRPKLQRLAASRTPASGTSKKGE